MIEKIKKEKEKEIEEQNVYQITIVQMLYKQIIQDCGPFNLTL